MPRQTPMQNGLGRYRNRRGDMREWNNKPAEGGTAVGQFEAIQSPSAWIGKLVHVEGWKRGCQFVLDAYNKGEAVLRTPKTGRVYRTRNRLLKARRYET